MMTDGEYGRWSIRVGHERVTAGVSFDDGTAGNEPAKCRLIPFPYYYGMLLEPVNYLVLLIGTLASTGWGFVLLGLL